MSFRRITALVAVAAALTACGSDDVTTTTTPPPPPGPTPVASVTVTAPSATLAVGATAQLTAVTRSAANAVLTGRTITWSSSAEQVATVSASGLVTAVGAGAATISATSEGKAGTVAITVAAAVVPVASVTVGTMPDTIEAWDVVPMTATLRDADANVLTGRTVRWSSSNPAVATVDSVTGMLTGLDRGSVVITATSEGKSGTATREVVIRYRSLSAGTAHACDIASGGLVWCWGLNGREGRIGAAELSDAAMSAVPVRVPGDQRFVQLSTYGRHSCAVSRAGSVWCWGTNAWDRLGGGTAASQSITPVVVAGGQQFNRVSVGADHSCAIAAGGALYCWGHNDWRQLGRNTPAQTPVPQIVAAGTSFKDVSAGSSFTCAVTVAGSTLCWGVSGNGQLGDGSPISYGNTFSATPLQVAGGLTFNDVSAAAQYACGLTTTAQAYCWGSGTGGVLGTGNTTDRSTPGAVADGHSFLSVSAGAGFACGVDLADAVWCWGRNDLGQLANGVAGVSTRPVRAGGAMTAAEVAAAGIDTGSGSFACAISKDRLTVRCWGRNDVGQLGNGATTGATIPNPTPSVVQGQKPN